MERSRSVEDTRFWNQFLLVTIVLHTIIIGFFVLARTVGAAQGKDQASDPSVLQAIDERIRPPARVAVAGETAPPPEVPVAAASTAPPAAPAAADMSGEQVFSSVCTACHAAGIAGAPRVGDAAAWGPRIAQGKAVLYRHSVEGYHGQSGFMPPKGGRPDLSEKSVHNAVDYMVDAARK